MQEYKRLNTAQMVQYMWHLSCRRQDSWRKQTRNSETIAQKVAIRHLPQRWSTTYRPFAKPIP